MHCEDLSLHYQHFRTFLNHKYLSVFHYVTFQTILLQNFISQKPLLLKWKKILLKYFSTFLKLQYHSKSWSNLIVNTILRKKFWDLTKTYKNSQTKFIELPMQFFHSGLGFTAKIPIWWTGSPSLYLSCCLSFSFESVV